MAGKDRGLNGFLVLLRTVISMLWLVVSTVVYALLVIVVAPCSRALAWQCARIWCRQLLWVCGVRLHLHGVHKLDHASRYVIISNHQSHLDIPALMTCLPSCRLTFAAKKELFAIPVFGWGLRALGHIQIDRSSARTARASILAAARRLKKADVSVVIFPEGTRSPDGSLGPFKRGSLTLALESGLPVVPVAVSGSGRVVPKKVLRVFARPIHVFIGDPIAPETCIYSDKEALSTHLRGQIHTLLTQGEKFLAPEGKVTA